MTRIVEEVDEVSRVEDRRPEAITEHLSQIIITLAPRLPALRGNLAAGLPRRKILSQEAHPRSNNNHPSTLYRGVQSYGTP